MWIGLHIYTYTYMIYYKLIHFETILAPYLQVREDKSSLLLK